MTEDVKIAREQLLVIAILADHKVGSAIREVVSKYLSPAVPKKIKRPLVMPPSLTLKRKPGRPRAKA